MGRPSSYRALARWRMLAPMLVCAALADCASAPPPAPAPAGPSAADVMFEHVASRYMDEWLALNPVMATELGDHRHDDRLDDIGPTARGERAKLAHELLDALTSIDARSLSRAHQVDAQLLAQHLRYEIWSIEELKEWRWNPLLYTELAGNSLYLLMARDFAPLPVRLSAAAARLEALPRLLAQVRETLDPAAVPHIHAEIAIQQNPGVLELVTELIEPQLHLLPEADQARLRSAIGRARTAVSQQQIWLEKRLLPEAKGDFRFGAQRYDEKLHFALDSALSREEIRARAQAELTRTRQQMYVIARSVLAGREGAPQLPESPTAAEEQAGIEAALALADAQAPERTAVFDAARQSFEEARRFVQAQDFITLYDDPLDIVPMPRFEQGVALAFCDPPGPLDRGLKTFYVVSPIPADWPDERVRSFLREYNTRAIDELTIHEAMPGHYVQLAHANRYESPLRAVLQSGTFIEGWAVYAERLMQEQGFRGGDPLMHLIQLKWYLRSIGNAILDQAVHVDGMTREQALQLMVHDTFQQEAEASAKWVRVQLTAAQLPTYFAGVQEHLALLEEARQRWGKSFTLKRYHDAVLSFGSPPVRYVRALLFDLPIPADSKQSDSVRDDDRHEKQ